MSHVFRISRGPSFCSSRSRCRYSRAPGVPRGRTRLSCWDESDEVCDYHSTVLLRLSPLRRAPVMRPCSCRLQKGCYLLQRRPALIDLYDPYPANRGLMRRDLWAKVLGAGGRCASRMRGLSVAPSRPGHLPPSTFPHPPSNPSRLQEIPRSKGGLAQWID